MQSILQLPIRNGLCLFVGIDAKSIEQLSERRWINCISLSHQIPAAGAQAIFRPAALQTSVNGCRRFAIIADDLVAHVHIGHRHLSILIEIDVQWMRGRMGAAVSTIVLPCARSVYEPFSLLSACQRSRQWPRPRPALIRPPRDGSDLPQTGGKTAGATYYSYLSASTGSRFFGSINKTAPRCICRNSCHRISFTARRHRRIQNSAACFSRWRFAIFGGRATVRPRQTR
jgi:hypothetical protein